MKPFIILILFVVASSSYVLTEDTDIKLDGIYKVENTFSGNTSSNESFHLIIAKNTQEKHYEIIPIINNQYKLNQIKSVIFDKVPSIVSFHNTNETVSIIVSQKGKNNDVFTVLDIDLISGESKKSNLFSGKDFKAVIRKENKNILLFSNDDEFKIIKVLSAGNLETIKVKSDKFNKELLKDLGKASIDAINTDEFIANGSINKFRVYAQENNVFITREDIKNNITVVSKIPLDKGENSSLVSKIYKTKSDEKINKSTSFINNDRLFQLQLNKNNGRLNIYNLENGNTSVFDLSKVTLSNKSTGFTTLESFIKKASRGVNEPTITVNETISGNIALRFDYVNKNKYNYQYNWWWHHQWMFQQQMMWQQQQMRASIPGGFGPSAPADFLFAINTEQHYFGIILNKENQILNSTNTETVYKYIDKKQHINALDDNVNIKHTSTVFLNNELRYFGYDKKSNSFRVLYKTIND